jgi:hypothetical protein
MSSAPDKQQVEAEEVSTPSTQSDLPKASPSPRPRRLRSASTTAGTERLNINIHVTTARALHEMSEAKGITQTETVRRAIALLKLLDEEHNRGVELHLVDPADTSKVRVLQLI